jgi:amino acid transporter
MEVSIFPSPQLVATLFQSRILTLHSYALQWLVVFPLEIVAAALTVQYWDVNKTINPAVWITIFWVLIVAINLFGVKGYGEAEFVFSLVKVVAVIGFM